MVERVVIYSVCVCVCVSAEACVSSSSRSPAGNFCWATAVKAGGLNLEARIGGFPLGRRVNRSSGFTLGLLSICVSCQSFLKEDGTCVCVCVWCVCVCVCDVCLNVNKSEAAHWRLINLGSFLINWNLQVTSASHTPYWDKTLLRCHHLMDP